MKAAAMSFASFTSSLSSLSFVIYQRRGGGGEIYEKFTTPRESTHGRQAIILRCVKFAPVGAFSFSYCF